MSDPRSPRARLVGLDLFRGLVITCMLFVNQLGEMPNVPAWLKHAPARTDTLTVPDQVFPAFLFMVGVAIPLAFARRARLGFSPASTVLHVLWRGAALILLGVVFDFHEALDPQRTGLARHHWLGLFFVGVFLAFHERRHETRLSRGLRLLGGLLIAGMLALFRDADGRLLQTEWWGILGMIGWSYVLVSFIALCARGRGKVLVPTLVAMIVFYWASRHGALAGLPRALGEFLDFGEVFGTVSAVVLIGVMVGHELESARPPPARLLRLLGFSLVLLAFGFALRPIHGISKIGTTESYALITSAISVALFAVLHFLADGVRVSTAPLWPLCEAGQNALVAYVFPTLFTCALAWLGLDRLWFLYAYPFASSSGLLACANAAVITLFYLLCVAGLSRRGVRLKL